LLADSDSQYETASVDLFQPMPPLVKLLPFVDALRGLAVAGMLIIHQSEWWMTPVARRAGVFATLYFLSKLVAPIFLTLVGVALALRFDPDELWLREFSHPHPTQLAFASGAVLLLFVGLQELYARGEPAWLEPLMMMGRASLFIYILHHLVGYTLFHFLGWHDQFGFPAVALMLLALFMVIYVILRALPGPVRVVHRVLS
jgi:uncharacterized membrane protein